MITRENIVHSFRSFSDTVEKVIASKFYNKTNPFYGRRFWILQCKNKNNKVNVFDEYLENKDFINKIENSSGDIFGKEFKFVVRQKGNYLINIEEVKGDEQ